ncbi:MAG: hypothetical protein PXX77_03455 [Gallionella sp.]|nr:hypothetical protein [Gallionella sp.]
MNRFISSLTLCIALASASLLPPDTLADGFASKDEKRAAFIHECLSTTTDSPSYMHAVDRVTSMPMVKDWVTSLTGVRRMAIGKHVDKTELVGRRCYWSISIYESDLTQLRLWKVFRVDVKTNSIFVMGDDGDYRAVGTK